MGRLLRGLEGGLGSFILVLMALFPVAGALSRALGTGSLPYAATFQGLLTLPLALLGISLAAREGRHLAIGIGLTDLKGTPGLVARSAAAFLTSLLAGLFFFSSLDFIFVAFDPSEVVVFLPRIVLLLLYPIALATVVVRTCPREAGRPRQAYVAGLALALPLSLPAVVTLGSVVGLDTSLLDAFGFAVGPLAQALVPLLLVAVGLGAFLGVPLFLVLGGLALVLFIGQGDGGALVLSEGYQGLAVGNTVPAIALFTLTGFFLSESQAANRFVRLFQSLFGPSPYGAVAVVVVVSAFFTTFTGANGITILALGALLIGILEKAGGRDESFSVGIVTSSGAIGLLFPPSLAVILFGSVSGTSIVNLFLAGLLPGVLMVVAMVIAGWAFSRRHPRLERPRTQREPLVPALLETLPELALPVLIAVFYFSGVLSLVETAAFAAVYSFVLEVVIRREIRGKDLMGLMVRALVVVGGVLAILTFARGLSSWFVDAGVPQGLTTWAKTTLGEPWVFLLVLNLFLLAVGCIVDLFTAITLLVPLLLPVARAFGIEDTHLAIIFLSNLTLGFLTPPVGMDLFLASYRFNRPLTKLYKDVLPFLGAQVVVVLIVTYVPWLTQAFLKN